MQTVTKVDWGHPVRTPEGVEIRLPKFAILMLGKLGLLVHERDEEMPQLSPLIHEFINPDYETLTAGLRPILGPDITGPGLLMCGCRECQRLHEEADKTPSPRRPEKLRGRYWLKVIRDPARN